MPGLKIRGELDAWLKEQNHRIRIPDPGSAFRSRMLIKQLAEGRSRLKANRQILLVESERLGTRVRALVTAAKLKQKNEHVPPIHNAAA